MARPGLEPGTPRFSVVHVIFGFRLVYREKTSSKQPLRLSIITGISGLSLPEKAGEPASLPFRFRQWRPYASFAVLPSADPHRSVRAGHATCIGDASEGGRAAMLIIGKLGSSPDQVGYYEQQVAQGLEDYFSGRGEAPGRWTGRGAVLVGATGDVDRTAFMRAMAGCDPRTGEQLKPPHGRTRVAAFDLTFSAPKSVSVLFAIAEEDTSAALLAAHEAAVAAALDYVEREACFTRRGHNGVERIRGDGFLAAAYRHRLSRAGDPQLHTHVVVANMTRAEGRWTSLEAHGLYEHKSAGGAVYRAVLRAEVRERLPGCPGMRPLAGCLRSMGCRPALCGSSAAGAWRSKSAPSSSPASPPASSHGSGGRGSRSPPAWQKRTGSTGSAGRTRLGPGRPSMASARPNSRSWSPAKPGRRLARRPSTGSPSDCRAPRVLRVSTIRSRRGAARPRRDRRRVWAGRLRRRHSGGHRSVPWARIGGGAGYRRPRGAVHPARAVGV
jgi:TrwC relaxase